MSKPQSWEVSDEFWKRVEPLVPQRVAPADKRYVRKPGAGRPRKEARLVFEGIVYVLRTGCQWKALPTSISCRRPRACRLSGCRRALLGDVLSSCSAAPVWRPWW